MIRLENVTKRYAGAARPAVDDFTLTFPQGEVTVLIGPSGCGKSTTLRMMNRLIEPDAGRILLNDVDVREMKLEDLRRGIGYAIQGVGLFPHWTVHENVGTVPWLLGWEQPRIDARVGELLDLVGLDAARYDGAYPDELSGGEAQRVGVARALAANPPVLLMDEPFGAVDPLTRERLQNEFLEIQRRLQKTVVFVTHDIDEAVRLGDWIAIMRDGRLIQFDRPERVLAYPVDRFVAEFVGSERALKRLSLATVDAVLDTDAKGASEYRVPIGSNLRQALARLLESGGERIAVTDDAGSVVGTVTLDDLMEHFRKPVA